MSGELPVDGAGVTTRGGSLHVQSIDAAAFELFTTPPRVRRADVRLSSLEPIRCPSPWRHPIAWLRWNPLQRRRVTLRLPNCEVEPAPGGAVTLTPHPTEENDAPDFRFAGDDAG